MLHSTWPLSESDPKASTFSEKLIRDALSSQAPCSRTTQPRLRYPVAKYPSFTNLSDLIFFSNIHAICHLRQPRLSLVSKPHRALVVIAPAINNHNLNFHQILQTSWIPIWRMLAGRLSHRGYRQHQSQRPYLPLTGGLRV